MRASGTYATTSSDSLMRPCTASGAPLPTVLFIQTLSQLPNSSQTQAPDASDAGASVALPSDARRPRWPISPRHAFDIAGGATNPSIDVRRSHAMRHAIAAGGPAGPATAGARAAGALCAAIRKMRPTSVPNTSIGGFKLAAEAEDAAAAPAALRAAARAAARMARVPPPLAPASKSGLDHHADQICQTRTAFAATSSAICVCVPARTRGDAERAAAVMCWGPRGD